MRRGNENTLPLVCGAEFSANIDLHPHGTCQAPVRCLRPTALHPSPEVSDPSHRVKGIRADDRPDVGLRQQAFAAEHLLHVPCCTAKVVDRSFATILRR